MAVSGAGRGRGRLSGALGGAALVAGLVSPALPARVAGSTSPEPECGRLPGNGRAPAASAAASVYYCDLGYFLFRALREGEKKSRVGAGGIGRWRARERRPGGEGGGRRLSPSSLRPEGSGRPRPGRKKQLLATLLCGVGKGGQGGPARTPPSGGAGAAAA